MQLVAFYGDRGIKLGIRTADGVLDVARAKQQTGLEAPEQVHDVINGGEAALAALKALLKAPGAKGCVVQEEGLRFAPCVPAPQKILCVGLNYRRHAIETKMAIPTTPVLFSKFQNALTGSGSAVPMPVDGKKVDYEVELCLVVGKRAQNVSEADALNYLFGYCTANDLSVRDLQFRTGQWLLGKSLDGFCPIGPYLVTRDEVPNPNNLPLRTWVNGSIVQNSNTNDMIFSCSQIVSYASRYMTLEPGDIILTGTPEGVVMGFPEDVAANMWLKAGDLVTVEVEGLGALANRFEKV